MSSITIKELSKLMGVSEGAIHNMIKNKIISNTFRHKNKWYINDYELVIDTFLKEKENKKIEREKKCIKVCETCGKIKIFKSVKRANLARKKSRLCLSCSRKETCKNPEIREKYQIAAKRRGENNRGENNYWFGKTIPKESLDKANKTRKENKKYQVYIKSDEFKEKMSSVTSGSKNPMFGKKVYDIWVEKYGKEVADQKQLEVNKKRSDKMKGSKNSMFGKCSPNKAGRGISGRYKNFYFRSLIELYYIITYLEPNNLPIISAERQDLTIPYTNYDGSERTYRADFLVGNTLIEVKPPKLKDTPLIKLKEEAAKKFCEERGMIYKIEFIEIKDYSKIKEMYINELIIIDEKKKQLIEKYL